MKQPYIANIKIEKKIALNADFWNQIWNIIFSTSSNIIEKIQFSSTQEAFN